MVSACPGIPLFCPSAQVSSFRPESAVASECPFLFLILFSPAAHLRCAMTNLACLRQQLIPGGEGPVAAAS